VGFILFDRVCVCEGKRLVFVLFKFLFMGCVEEKKQDIIATYVFVGYMNCLERMCLCSIEFVCCRCTCLCLWASLGLCKFVFFFFFLKQSF
jgi:hypothetical protein